MKINIYKNGRYLCSTVKARNCKQAINAIKTLTALPVAGKGTVKISRYDKLTAKEEV